LPRYANLLSQAEEELTLLEEAQGVRVTDRFNEIVARIIGTPLEQEFRLAVGKALTEAGYQAKLETGLYTNGTGGERAGVMRVHENIREIGMSTGSFLLAIAKVLPDFEKIH